MTKCYPSMQAVSQVVEESATSLIEGAWSGSARTGRHCW